jgi:hypothetical protein
MSFAVHIELTTEAPWANSWCAYYGIATNTGSAAEEAFEMQHEFFGPDGGQVSRGGLGGANELQPGAQFRTEEANLMPLQQGAHKLRISVWQDGNSVADAVHEFHVQ